MGGREGGGKEEWETEKVEEAKEASRVGKKEGGGRGGSQYKKRR